jgi:hypothetical protein
MLQNRSLVSNKLETSDILVGGNASTKVERAELGRSSLNVGQQEAGHLGVVPLVAGRFTWRCSSWFELAELGEQLVHFRGLKTLGCEGGENADCAGRFVRPKS